MLGDDAGDRRRRRPPVQRYRSKPSQSGRVLDSLVTSIIENSAPIKALGYFPQMNPNTVFLNHGGTLPDRPEHKPLWTLLKFEACTGAELEAFAHRLGENDAARLVDFDIHAINYGMCH